MPRRSALLLAVSLCALSASAREYGEGEPVREDPRARIRERIRQFGQRTPEEGLAFLQTARAEAEKVGLDGSTTHRLAARGTSLSAAQGKTWINLGPTNASFEKNGITYTKVDSGRVRRVLVHPTDPNIIYVATAGGGVWKTFDGTTPVSDLPGGATGPTWRPITESVGSLSVGSMAMDPKNPDILVLGLGDPFDNQFPGLVHSSDGGMSWSDVFALKGRYPGSTTDWSAMSVRHLEFDGAGTGVVLAATDVGVFRSTSGGVANDWALVDLSPTHAVQGCWATAWVGPQTWVASCDGDVFRSTDGGASWASVATGVPSAARANLGRLTVAAAASDSANPNAARVYLLAGTPNGDATLDVFRSSDGGRTWTGRGVNANNAPSNPNNDQPDLNVLHDQAWYNQMIAVDPRNRDHVVIGGNLSMVRTVDGGSTWDVMSDWLPTSPLVSGAKLPYVHADWHAGTFSYAGDKFVFYGGTDGGIFRSTDLFTNAGGKATFEDRLNRGIATHLIYFVATDETNSNNQLVLGGFQDNGTRLRAAPNNPSDTSHASTTFDQVWGGDGIGVALGRAISNRVLGAWGTLMVVTNPDSMQRSANGGVSFSSMMSGLPVDQFGDVPGNFYMKVITDFGDANGQTFLTLVNQAGGSRVYKWIDNGSTQNAWADISTSVLLKSGTTQSGIPVGLSMITADPKHAGQYGAVGSNRAYRKLAGSTQWVESAAAPKGALASIAFDPSNTTTFWVGSRSSSTGGRVFVTSDGGGTWTVRSGTGATALPDVPVFVVKVDPNDAKTIYAGTEIGLYRSTDSGATWSRHGAGLPLVAVTDLSIALDSSAIRISTWGRGFWELFPSFGAPAGVYGDGDFDGNGVIDGFDLVAFGTVMGLTTLDAGYNAKGNLVGSSNSIDGADLAELMKKIGARP